MSNATDWQHVAAIADISVGELFGAKYAERDIVLVRSESDVFALGGICPHAYALMCDGFLNGSEIECPLHAAIFDVQSGRCLDGPAGTGDLATYEVKIVGEDILVRPRP